MNAEIRMQSAMTMISEGVPSTMVCAIISGVAGNLEEAVDATLTLTGSTKAGTLAASFRHNVTVHNESKCHYFCMIRVAQLLDK